MAAPFLLELGESTPAADWPSVCVGVAALIQTMFTNHKVGTIRVLPCWLCVFINGAVGVSSAIDPFVLGVNGLDAWSYWANAAAMLTVVSQSKPSSLSTGHAGVAATA